MEYEEFVAFRKHYDVTRWVFHVADVDFWHSEVSGPESPETMRSPILNDLAEYHHRCPCCGYAAESGDREFDFHHWDYEDDIGCQLCRKCHTYIHRGLSASEQRREVGTDWESDAAERLYERATSNGLEFEQAYRFCLRFNIPGDNPAQDTINNLLRPDDARMGLGEVMPDE
jgi:hypothetical protein